MGSISFLRKLLILFAVFISFFIIPLPALKAQNKPTVEERLQKLETEKEVTKALMEKDKELKDILEKEIQRSIEMQTHVQETASKTINVVGWLANIIAVLVGALASILAFFGIKSFKDLKKQGENQIKDISNKMNDFCNKAETDQKVIADLKVEIEKIHKGMQSFYEETKSKPTPSTDFSQQEDKLTAEEKLALGEVVLKFDIAEKMGVNLDASDYMKIATKNYFERNYELAIRALSKVVELEPDNANAYVNWGVALGKLEKHKEAIEKFKKAIELKPDHEKAYSNWSVALSRLEKHEEAIEKIKKAIEIESEDADAYFNWGFVLSNSKKYEEALEKYKKVIELKPKDQTAYYNWGVTLGKLNKYEDAIEKYKKAIELKPDYVNAYINWGIALNNLKKYEDAMEKFQKANELEPEEASNCFNLACGYSLLNKVDLCCENLKKAIRLDSKYKIEAKKDPDFNNVKDQDCFKRLIE